MSRTMKNFGSNLSSEEPAFTRPSELPKLSLIRTSVASCCLALSCPLVLALRKTFAVPVAGPILSVGSGSGLLEAYMVAEEMDVIGIDLANVNKYLCPERFVGLRGTWDNGPIALLACARKILFVYPKPVEHVIRRYIEQMGQLEVIVWIGPATDWPEAISAFDHITGWSKEATEIFGVTEPYERFMVLRG